jgi:hypothetical protein
MCFAGVSSAFAVVAAVAGLRASAWSGVFGRVLWDMGHWAHVDDTPLRQRSALHCGMWVPRHMLAVWCSLYGLWGCDACLFPLV